MAPMTSIRRSLFAFSRRKIVWKTNVLVKRGLGTYERTTSSSTGSPWKTTAAATTSAVCCFMLVQSATQSDDASWLTRLEQRKDDDSNAYATTERPAYRLDIRFMNKLASKAYLHFKDSSEPCVQYEHRPPGVPQTLRLLTVDLPEVRDAFRQGTCRLQADAVYPDGVAADRVVHLPVHQETTAAGTAVQKDKKKQSKSNTNNKDATIQLHVEQKAWIKSMIRCVIQDTDTVGVQIMQADTGALNPLNLRRTRQFGTLGVHDPGKYATINREKTQSRRKTVKVTDTSSTSTTTSSSDAGRPRPQEDELQAPWNQCAWMDELKLRISGQVVFGEPLEKAGRWSRYFYGTTYRSTVSSSQSAWAWLTPFGRKDPAGRDGESDSSSWASNKPHAVIANGAALQLVPNSLRLLQKACRDADVPLYVIRDPRVWGANTHNDLSQVLRELRKTVKSRIVSTSLHQAVGTAFQRGRWLGNLESDTKWQAKDHVRKTKETVRKTKETMRRASVARKQEEQENWGHLDESSLEQQLASRGVIQQPKGKGAAATERSYTSGMIALAKQCVADQLPSATEQAPANDAEGKTGASDESASSQSLEKPNV